MKDALIKRLQNAHEFRSLRNRAEDRVVFAFENVAAEFDEENDSESAWYVRKMGARFADKKGIKERPETWPTFKEWAYRDQR